MAPEQDLGLPPHCRIPRPFHVDQHWHGSAVPVVCNNNATLAIGEATQWKLTDGCYRCATEVCKAELVVLKVRIFSVAVESAFGLCWDFAKEHVIVDEHIVDTFHEGMKEVECFLVRSHLNLLPEACVPRFEVLVVAWGNHHDTMTKLCHGLWQTVHGFSKSSSLGERCDLACDEDDLVLLSNSRTELAVCHGEGRAAALCQCPAHSHCRRSRLGHVESLAIGPCRRRGKHGTSSLGITSGRSYGAGGVGCATRLSGRHGLATHNVQHACGCHLNWPGRRCGVLRARGCRRSGLGLCLGGLCFSANTSCQ
mmetsp:Transcript_123114/g.173566  ORF Transcript_123114/g.173566 Transcript_123114/m.173566 type:complete len:310 (+) Transcript_123114:611-1540(+)